MLEKTESYTSIELKSLGQVQLKKTTTILEDGVELSQSHHREIRYPGDDVSDLPVNISSSINAYWTPEVIETWQAHYSASIAEAVIDVSGSL